MANFLRSLGFDFLNDNEDTLMNFLDLVVQNGKEIQNYHGLPYFNEHFGSTQVICRVGHKPDGEGLQLTGFDTHADSLCVWKMRVQQKLNNTDSEDPTCVKVLAKGMDGSGLLTVDVVNGDILPSFKEDEVIDLQMVAFADDAEFFADEKTYEDTVEPGPNGVRTMIMTNTLFPAGVFSENEEIKDVVQIHGIIKQMKFGVSEFGDQVLRSNIHFYVDTQFGEIVIIIPTENIHNIKSKENMEVGSVIDCFARLSGDAAIYAYENGIVKGDENNLKLVAYTLEGGDPERLRSVLSRDFVYHSENTGKHFDNADELIDLVKAIQNGRKDVHTSYATITQIEDGPDELEYPVGTRCAVISYENEKGYNSIVFVDTDEHGDIKRIYLSREARYKFTIDDPFQEAADLPEMIAETNYQTSMIQRAYFFGLIDKNMDKDAIEAYISGHRNELEDDISDLIALNSSEEVFAEAFLRGVRRSSVTEYREKDIREIGRMFHKDATLFKSEAVQKETYHDALILADAIGCLYKGRVDE